MVRMNDIDPELGEFLDSYRLPEVPGAPWVRPPPGEQRCVALISTAGLKLPGDRPFSEGAGDWRAIPTERAGEAVMDHLSVSHDRTGFNQDLNVVFPLDRLAELAGAGAIGSVADYHYSFMGASDPERMEPAARRLAATLVADAVDAALFCPV